MPTPTDQTGGGDGGSPPPASSSGTSARSAPPPSDQGSTETNPRRAAARDMIGRYGAERAVMQLMRDNYRLRETRREVPEGAVVLTGDDATAYQAYRQLNLTPKQVTDALTERDSLRTWRGERERADHVATIAAAAGYKASVLQTVIGPRLAAGATLELRDVSVERNGQTVTERVPHLVTGTGDGATAERLSAVIERDFADFLPALTAGDAARGSTGTTSTTSGATGTAAQGATSAARFPAQRATASEAGGDRGRDVTAVLVRTSPSQIRAQRDKALGRAPAT